MAGASDRGSDERKRDEPFTFADENKQPRKDWKVKICGLAHNGSHSEMNDSRRFNSRIIGFAAESLVDTHIIIFYNYHI